MILLNVVGTASLWANKAFTETFATFFTVSQVLAWENQAKRKSDKCNEKAVPCCRLCKNPMKGHKYVKDCPKNK